MRDASSFRGFRLRGLSDEEAPADLVETIVAASRAVRARRGQIVLEHGMETDDVYLVSSGRVRVELLAVGGRDVAIRDLVAGQLFGELAAIDRGRRSASITALDPTELLLVPAATFRAAVAGSPAAAGWFFGHLAALIRNLTDRVFEMTALNVQARIHCQLVRMAAAAGVDGNRAVIDPMPTHEELAALVGTHREAVTRELSWLSREGLIVQQRRRLEIEKFMELSMLAARARGTEL
jgi:CRP/FNR family cyclic AMP-dependent transcriptional regulator